jgi:hypothetical protein
VYADVVDNVPGSGAYLDRGNRGPIAALTKHYISANQYTVFSYYSKGGYIYSETDEVFMKNGSVLHQSAAGFVPPSVDQVYRWATYFPAMGVDIGVPDVNGYNQGNRNLQWKRGVDIDATRDSSKPGLMPADVWRRDYTKAVVLHRPASWDTSAIFYNTPFSSPVWLGATYYPLLANGKTGPGVQSISLRANEGVILMKSPIY